MSKLAAVGMLLGMMAGLHGDAQQAADAAPKPEKYPLRLHILAVDDTHQTARMQPNWCGGTVPVIGDGGDVSPCSNSGSAGLGGGSDDLAGAGRGDLVLPPDQTEGVSFTYEGCPRVRVLPGFYALDARWKKPGSKLEVLVPTDDPTRDGHVKTQACTVSVTVHEFVYLRTRRGIVQVAQDAYARKPSLRRFMSGGSAALEARKASVVSVEDLAHPAAPAHAVAPPQL